MLSLRQALARRTEPSRTKVAPRKFVGGVAASLCTTARPGGVPVGIASLSVDGARLLVDNEVDARFVVGQVATLVLTHEEGPEFRLSARLQGLQEQPIARVLTFGFVDAAAGEVLLHPRVAHLFNQRASFRVVPSPEQPIQVTVVATCLERPVHEVGSVLDLSTGGIGMEVSAAFERLAASQDRVLCVLTMPGTTISHSVVAVIRHRRLLPSGRVRYGLLFELGVDAAARRAYDAILAYIVRRQHEVSTRPGL